MGPGEEYSLGARPLGHRASASGHAALPLSIRRTVLRKDPRLSLYGPEMEKWTQEVRGWGGELQGDRFGEMTGDLSGTRAGRPLPPAQGGMPPQPCGPRRTQEARFRSTGNRARRPSAESYRCHKDSTLLLAYLVPSGSRRILKSAAS